MQFQQGLKFVVEGEDKGAKKLASEIDAAVGSLKDTFIEVGNAGTRFDSVVGDFVDSAGRVASSTETLNSLGVRTSAQIQGQVKAYDTLIAQFKRDSTESRQLIRLRENLLRQYGLLNTELGDLERVQRTLSSQNIQTTASIQAQANALDEAIAASQGDRVATEGLVAAKRQLALQYGGLVPGLDETARLQAELARSGIATTQTFEDQLRVLDQLEAQVQDDVVALNQLANVRARVTKDFDLARTSTREFGVSANQAQTAARSLGFALNDSSQFLNGFQFGLLAIANNMDNLLAVFGDARKSTGSLGGAFKAIGSQLTGTLGIVVGFQALVLAIQVVPALFEKLGLGAEDLSEKFKGVADSIIEIENATKISFSGSLEEVEEEAKRIGDIVSALTEERNELRNQSLQAINSSSALGISPNAATFTAEQQERLNTVLRVLSQYEGVQESINEKVEEENLLREITALASEGELKQNEETLASKNKQLTLEERLAKEVGGQAEALGVALQRAELYRRGVAQTVAFLERQTQLVEQQNAITLGQARIVERVKTLSEEITNAVELERIARRNAALDLQSQQAILQDQLDGILRGESDVTLELERQNEELEEQIEVRGRIRQEQLRQQRIESRFGDRGASSRQNRIGGAGLDAETGIGQGFRASGAAGFILSEQQENDARLIASMRTQQAVFINQLTEAGAALSSTQLEVFQRNERLLAQLQSEDPLQRFQARTEAGQINLRQPGGEVDPTAPDAFLTDEQRAAQQEALAELGASLDTTVQQYIAAGGTAQEFFTSTAAGTQALAGSVSDAFGAIGNILSTVFEVTGRKHKAFFIAYKATAIAQATVDTYRAANLALASAPPPFGAIGAGIAIATGLANVAKIVAARPGGSGGSGGGSVRAFDPADTAFQTGRREGAQPFDQLVGDTSTNTSSSTATSDRANIDGEVIGEDGLPISAGTGQGRTARGTVPNRTRNVPERARRLGFNLEGFDFFPVGFDQAIPVGPNGIDSLAEVTPDSDNSEERFMRVRVTNSFTSAGDLISGIESARSTVQRQGRSNDFEVVE